jgi:hypothetical protein
MIQSSMKRPAACCVSLAHVKYALMPMPGATASGILARNAIRKQPMAAAQQQQKQHLAFRQEGEHY